MINVYVNGEAGNSGASDDLGVEQTTTESTVRHLHGTTDHKAGLIVRRSSSAVETTVSWFRGYTAYVSREHSIRREGRNVFIGHCAIGFASKRVAPTASLGVLMAAPVALDLLWPLFLLAGWEKVRIDPGNTAFTPLDFVSYPYSHSLAMAAVWAAALGLLYWVVARYTAGALVVGVGVLSHWLLDAITHRSDLPLFPGGIARVGLGLWNSVPGTMSVEIAMFVAGVWLYSTTTRPRDRAGFYGYWAFLGVLMASYFANAFGPPPPSESFLARFSLGLWAFPLWAFWFDRHRHA